MRTLKGTLVCGFVGAALMAATAPLAMAASAVATLTPAGITLIEVVRELPLSQPELLWMRPGNAEGRTLFTYESDQPGVAKCIAECAKEWAPLAVSANSKAFGDWSIVKRPDGISQWAYKAKPLYTWTKEEVPGDVATTVGVKEVGNSKLAENAVKLGTLEPPGEWKVARFAPSITETAPDGIEFKLVPQAQGLVLTAVAGGLTLYAFDGDAKKDNQVCTAAGCSIKWVPAPVPELAGGVGDFTVVQRADGTRQWAYKKKPLYTYKGDKLPGDVKGVGVDKKWTAAVVGDIFRPAQVSVAFREGYGDTLTLNGKTLYTGIGYEARWGGRNLRDNYRNAYVRGKKLGGGTCVTDLCLALWTPFRPAADAQSNGFWEVITREDGSKQWAYKGYALYTYMGDKVAGDMNGNDIYDIINDGSEGSYKQAAFLASVNGRAGVYWHTAKP
jgi:predicted lipoprotein with Yx(FWY)xxD motif